MGKRGYKVAVPPENPATANTLQVWIENFPVEEGKPLEICAHQQVVYSCRKPG